MSNVLPVPDKKRLWSFHRSRLILITSISLIVSALISFVALAPSYIMLMMNRPTIDPNATNSGNERTTAFAVQSTIADLLPYSGTTTPVDSIAHALEQKPVGVSITQISYRTDQAGQKTIVLSGIAKGREQINNYRKILEDQGAYKKVAVPVGDLIGVAGNQFTFTLTLL